MHVLSFICQVEVALTVDAVAVLTTALVKISVDERDLLNFKRGEFYLHMECSSDPIKSLPHGHKILQYILNVISVVKSMINIFS